MYPVWFSMFSKGELVKCHLHKIFYRLQLSELFLPSSLYSSTFVKRDSIDRNCTEKELSEHGDYNLRHYEYIESTKRF